MAITINGTTGIAGVDGSASTPAVQGTDTNTGIFYPAADTIAFAEGGAEVARFDSSGRLGVGTTSPSYVVDAAGTSPRINVAAASTSYSGYRTANTSGNFQFVIDDSTGSSFLGTAYARILYSSGAYPLLFATNDTERARITSGGLMLLGVTSTLGGQTAYLTTRGTASDVGITVGVTNNGYNAMKFLNQDNTVVGSIVNNSGGTAFNTTSDYRLKENVTPMTGALATVSALKPCTYTWKADGAAGQGFIAHELQAVVPDCVTGEKDATETYTDDNGVEQTRPKYQGVDTSYLVATLTAAIQELKAELDTTKARLAALEAK